MAKQDKKSRTQVRHARVRKNLSGTPEKPRMAVFRSNKNISVQIIDDVTGTTLCSASSLEKAIKAEYPNGGNKEAAKAVGEAIAKKAAELAGKAKRSAAAKKGAATRKANTAKKKADKED